MGRHPTTQERAYRVQMQWFGGIQLAFAGYRLPTLHVVIETSDSVGYRPSFGLTRFEGPFRFLGLVAEPVP